MHTALPGNTAIWLSDSDDQVEMGLCFVPCFSAMLTRLPDLQFHISEIKEIFFSC